jgi:hypothetical protein
MFDVLPARSGPGAMARYRLLVLDRTALERVDVGLLEDMVRAEGLWLLASPDAGELLQRFHISCDEGGTTRRARIVTERGCSGGRVPFGAAEVEYCGLSPAPETAHAVADPGGAPLLGEWRRGRGRVFVSACGHGREALAFQSRCIERCVRLLPPVFQCDEENICFGAYPEDEEAWTLFWNEGDGAGERRVPPVRLYLAQVAENGSAGGVVRATLRVRNRRMPLEWPAGGVGNVFAAGGVVLHSRRRDVYFERATGREAGYEVLARGRGETGITLVSLSGRVRAIECGGEDIEFSAHPECARAVQFRLRMTAVTRFRVSLEKS